MKPTTSEFVEVRKSEIHNKGIFAAKDIPKGTKIIEYVGKKLTKKQSEVRADELMELWEEDPENYGGVYIFEINSKHDIDGSVNWNTDKYINHSCDPNCESDIFDGHIWITAIKDIQKGEELHYNYGYDIDSFEDHPCECGSKNCVGYIVAEEDWPKLRRKLRKKEQKGKKKLKDLRGVMTPEF